MNSFEKKFESVMEKVGHDVEVVFEDVVKYLPDAAAIASLLFPQAAGEIAVGVSSVDLIQKAVVTVEQKFAATGKVSGTGAQKLAHVVSIVSPTVTQLLIQEKVPDVNSKLIANITNAVVAILNVTPPKTA